MSYRPPGTFRVLRLLALTSVRRLFRAAKVGQQKKARKQGLQSGAGKRRATSRKRGDGLMWLMVLLTPLFIFQGSMMATRAAQNLADGAEMVAPGGKTMVLPRNLYWELIKKPGFDEPDLLPMLEEQGVTEQDRPSRSQVVDHWRQHGMDSFRPNSMTRGTAFLMEPIDWQDNDEARRVFVQASSVLLFLLALTMLTIALGGANATLAGGEWTQAWLMTFPVATRSLVVARALEYSLVQFFPWFTIAPLSYQLLRALGEPGALLIAVLATLVTTFLVGAVRLWAETSLRLRLTLHGLKNVQGACTIVSLLLMGILFAVVLGSSVPFVFLDIAAAMPGVVALLPGAWPLGLASFGGFAFAVGFLITAAAFAFALFSTARQLRGGIMRSGGVDTGSRGKSFNWQRHAKRLGVAGKDLMLLRRDRNFLVQTLLVPVFVVALQLIVNPGLGNAKGVGVAMIAYFVGMYGCLGGCFQVLSGEGRALWMLYTLPVSIAEVLRRKTLVWSIICVTFATLALVAFALVKSMPIDGLLLDWVFVSIGVWGAAHIASGIGVLGANPTADYIPRQPKPRHIYLFFFFGSTYFAVLSSDSVLQRIAGTLIFVTVAYAIWQRACERLKWLLDPVEEPRDHISLMDGGSAVLVFFVLQILAVLVLSKAGRLQPSLADVSLAFAVGGATTVMLFVLLLKWRGVQLVQALGFSQPLRRAAVACLIGIAAGCALGAIGLGYTRLVAHYEWFDLPSPKLAERTQLLLLACIAAPIVEEILFRGMVFQGLMRSVRLPWAVGWSAMLFMVVHPHVSWPPVFLLGVTAAVLLRRTGYLPAAMLLHATYNYIVVAYQ